MEGADADTRKRTADDIAADGALPPKPPTPRRRSFKTRTAHTQTPI